MLWEKQTNKQEKYPGLEIGGKGNFFVLKKVQRNRWTLSQTWMNKTYGFYTFVYVSKKAEIRVEDQEAPCINWVHVRRVCVCTEKQWLEREKAETAAPGINIGTYRHTRHPKWAELQWRTNWRLIDVTWLDSVAITTRGESFLNCVTAITWVLLSFSICYWLIFSIITLTIQVISLYLLTGCQTKAPAPQRKPN